MKFLKIISVVSILALGLIISGQAQGGAPHDEYPSKPVRIVVGFSAGGPSDILARLFAQKLGELLGHRFITDNRPGASGMIGAELVAKAPPDGYKLLMVPATHSVNPASTRTNARHGISTSSLVDWRSVCRATRSVNPYSTRWWRRCGGRTT